MTDQTFRKLVEQLFTVGFRMAFAASGYIAMFAMTCCTVYSGVLAWRSQPQRIYFFMAGSAGPRIDIPLVADLPGPVHRMAFTGTGCKVLAGIVRFVTSVAVGQKSVLGVALTACQLGMGAGELPQFLEFVAVAEIT